MPTKLRLQFHRFTGATAKDFCAEAGLQGTCELTNWRVELLYPPQATTFPDSSIATRYSNVTNNHLTPVG